MFIVLCTRQTKYTISDISFEEKHHLLTVVMQRIENILKKYSVFGKELLNKIEEISENEKFIFDENFFN